MFLRDCNSRRTVVDMFVFFIVTKEGGPYSQHKTKIAAAVGIAGSTTVRRLVLVRGTVRLLVQYLCNVSIRAMINEAPPFQHI
jgi:hypothetical protein